MSSIWPSALASLDESLAALDRCFQNLEAAQAVDEAEAIEQFKAAAEFSGNLRALLLSEAPDAAWNDRGELGVLVEARHVEHQRARLLALAAELERGTIAHRRAARVTQMNQLRQEAIGELRSQAAVAGAPPVLPGPEPEEWVDWACCLQEPNDAESLQLLRKGFVHLDEFVASLEAGMWNVPAAAGVAPAKRDAATSATLDAKELEQRRSRLLDLAAELERGSIVHHRALRVTQLSQLRDQAITELRLQAGVKGRPPALPGPEANRWVRWACGLKEPEDAESLQSLRRFTHLDEFVANLELDMWKAEEPSTPVPPLREPEKPVEKPAARAHREPSGVEVYELEAPAAASRTTEFVFPREVVRETADEPSMPARIVSRMGELWKGNRRTVLATAGVLVFAVLTTMYWTLHRTHASTSPVKPAEAAPVVAQGNPVNPIPDTSAVANTPVKNGVSDPHKDNNSKTKDQIAAAAKPPVTAPPDQPVALLNDASVRTPQAIPKAPAAATTEEAAVTAPGIPGALPRGAAGGVPNPVANIVKTVPVTEPRVRPSSGVAQGLLIHRVTPVYPTQARLNGIQGTVVMQAVVAKDGRVQSVHVLRGPPLLTQAATDAVRQWRYKPFLLNGEPAEAEIQISINFTP